MNVLVIINADVGSKGSLGFRALPVIREALRRKHQVKVIARGGSRIPGVETIFMPAGSLTMKGLTAVQMYAGKIIPVARLRHAAFERFVQSKLSDDLIRWADVVHSWDFLPRVYAHIRMIKPRMQITQDVQMAFPEILRTLKRWDRVWSESELHSLKNVRAALQYPDRFIVPSVFVKESCHAVGIPTPKISVVPFGVDHRLFRPRKQRKHVGVLRIAYVGSVNLRKGFQYFREAVDQLKVPVETHVYGRVYPEAKHLVRGSRFILHGHCDIPDILPHHDIFVFPSLVEGSSKATYEAMACGLPVITTPNSGSLVRDGHEGFIVPPEDSAALRRRIEQLAKDSVLRKRMGSAARKRIMPFTWERYGKDVVSAIVRR